MGEYVNTAPATDPLLGLYPLGWPQPLAVPHLGLVYRGEVIHGEHWDPAWGKLLNGDQFFRIVLLRHPKDLSADAIHDSRIAVCVPGKGPPRGSGQARKELLALREVQALYFTRRAPETAPIVDHLKQQQDKLESQFTVEEAARYARGHIESPTVFSDGPGAFFTGPEPATWFHKLAAALLDWAYPRLPLDSARLSRPLRPEDVPPVYQALFTSRADARAPLAEFGPGLGLSSIEEPLVFNPTDCHVFRLIRTELENRLGELPWNDVRHSLAYASGLTQPLATMYLLAFVYYGQPETELALSPGHHLSFLDGRTLRGTRLTREFIPLLPWRDDHFAGKIVSVRLPAKEVAWNDALQYTSILCQGLLEMEEGSPDLAKQERVLLDALSELAGKTNQAGGVLDALSSTISCPNEVETRSSLHRLSSICGGNNYRDVYQLARGAYGGPQWLRRELDIIRRLMALGQSIRAIIDTKAYLDGAEVRAGYQQLSADRMALMEEMSLPVFLASPMGWSTFKALFQKYQERYSRSYRDHHHHYQRQISRIWGALEDSRLKLHALTLLNAIPELGGPMGLGLEQRFNDLGQEITLCGLPSPDLPLHASPRCPNCVISLGEAPPAQEVDQFLRDLDRALGEQNRRLSLVLVSRIIHGQVDQRLEDFLKIVQASDLSALSNTLTDELTQWIRQLIGGA